MYESNYSFSHIIQESIPGMDFWAQIIASIVIIFLGYILVKIGLFKLSWREALIGIVMNLALPLLILKGFMSEITLQSLQNQIIILALSLSFYIISSFIIKAVLNQKQKLIIKLAANESINFIEIEKQILKKEKMMVFMCMLCFWGAATFGLPIVAKLFSSEGIISTNLWTVGQRIFLYSFVLLQFKDIKIEKHNFKKTFKKMFLNPNLICTILGFILWISQLGTQVYLNSSISTTWFNLSKTAPFIYQSVNILSSLAAPLIWLSIGITLNQTPLKEAISDKSVWIFCFFKLVLLPLIFLAILAFIKYSYQEFPINEAATVLILSATPPAATIVAFSFAENRAIDFASRASSISTLLSIGIIPIWLIIGRIVFSLI